MRKLTSRLLAMAFLIAASSSALAHPGHDLSGWTAGFMHPFSGLDHLLAMVAVGLWAAQCGGQKTWLLPLAFMMALALGAEVAQLNPSLPIVEAGIATSVLTLGLLVALSLKLPAGFAFLITTLFGAMHGYAHGLELPASATPTVYALGFLVATAILHLLGITAGIATRHRLVMLPKLLGLGIAASGVFLFVTT